MKRRFFLFAAPAIVAAPSLMKISALAMPARAAFWDIPYTPGTFARYSGYEIVHLSPKMMVNVQRTNALIQWAQDRALTESISGISELMRGAQSA